MGYVIFDRATGVPITRARHMRHDDITVVDGQVLVEWEGMPPETLRWSDGRVTDMEGRRPD